MEYKYQIDMATIIFILLQLINYIIPIINHLI
jgi:hypothetical protein